MSTGFNQPDNQDANLVSGGNQIFVSDGQVYDEETGTNLVKDAVEMLSTEKQPASTAGSGELTKQSGSYPSRAKQLASLRTSTAPKDASLDKSASLPREERLGKPLPPPEKVCAITATHAIDSNRLVPHPWHRYFARFIDNILLGAVAGAGMVLIKVSAHMAGPERLTTLLGTCVAYGALLIAILLLEPVLLTVFGRTPGKLLFGIRVVDATTGDNLTFGKAVRRCLWLLWYCGQILTIIPVVGMVAPIIGMYMQFTKLNTQGITSYDHRIGARVQHGY